jgi:hypothetical protein
MSKAKSLLMVVAFASLLGCESRYPMEKRFWTPEDYKKVWYEIKFETAKGEEYPRLASAETADVFRKIIDKQNYLSLLEDAELGLRYRNEVSQGYFEYIIDIIKLYSGMDVQDKFIYAQELIELRKFFLDFQIVYFRVGNENIADKSDDRNTIRKNEQTIIGNFENYLENLREEKAYGSYAPDLADGITIQFAKLIETFPNANYSGMLATAKTMQQKVVTPEIKAVLSQLIIKLELKQPKPVEEAK